MDRSYIKLLFFGLFTAKMAIFATLGPQWGYDTAGYVDFAERILSNTKWIYGTTYLFEPNTYWGEFGSDSSSFRMMGYPILMSMTMLISADYWDWIIVAFQITFGTLATCYLFHVLYLISGNRNVAMVLAILQAIGLNFAVDASVLTDSFYLSLLLVLTGLTVQTAITCLTSWRRVAAMALCVLAAFLLREASSTLCLLWAPAIWIAYGRCGQRRVSTLIGLVSITFAPMLLVEQGYKIWNWQRTGMSFVTTSMQGVALYPLVNVKKKHPDLAIGVSPLDDVLTSAVAQHLPSFYPEVRIINRRLLTEYNLTPPQIANLAMQSVVAAWKAHPILMVINTFRTINPGSLVLVSPISAFGFMQSFEHKDDDTPRRSEAVLHRRRAFVQAAWTWYAFYVAQAPLLLLSAAMLVSYILVAAMLAVNSRLRRLPLGGEMLALSIIPPIFFGAHSAFFIETRYMMPMIPIVFIILAWSYKNRSALGFSSRFDELIEAGIAA